MEITTLSELNLTDFEYLLKKLGIVILGYHNNGGYLRVECPSCQSKDAYIYINRNTRKLECNSRNNCGYNELVFDMLLGNNNKEKLEYVHHVLGKNTNKFTFENKVSNNNNIAFRKTEPLYTDIELNGEQKEFLEACDSIFKASLREYGNRAQDYLLSRGYTTEQIKKFNLGYFLDKKNLKEKLTSKHIKILENNELKFFGKIYFELTNSKTNKTAQHRLVFTSRDGKGEILGFTVRRIGEGELKYLNMNKFSKSKHFFNLKASEVYKKIVIVEGQFDALAGSYLTHKEIQERYHFIASMQNRVSEGQAKLLNEYNIKEVILLIDNDKAGADYEGSVRNLTQNSINTKVIRFANEFSDVKDLDQFLRKHPDKQNYLKSLLNLY